MRNALLIAALLTTSHAYADRPKYSRKQHLDLDAKLSERVKPTREAAPAEAQPTLTAEDHMLVEERAQPLRRGQEAKLLELIEKTPDEDPDKPDLLFRLAEHYAQQLRFWRLKAVGITMPARAR
jgi:hypothetical protein